MSENQGAPGDGRRLGSSQAVAFDEAAVEAVLDVRETGDRTDGRSQSVRDRRRQRSLVQRRRIRQRCAVVSPSLERGGAPTRWLPRGRQRGERSVCTGKTEAGTTPSSVGQSGPDRRKTVWRNAGRAFRGEVGGVVAAHPSGRLHARQSGDDTGARVERRLQKLARSIFLVPPRSPRGGRGGAVVARHGGRPGRGRSSMPGERVQSAPRRVPSPGNSGALTRPQGRESSQRKALWSHAWSQP